MWLLVMLIISGDGPSFSVYPKPTHSAAECQMMLTQTEARLDQLKDVMKGKEVKTELKCVSWDARDAKK